jgi:outer membrane protein assembly factor BamB
MHCHTLKSKPSPWGILSAHSWTSLLACLAATISFMGQSAQAAEWTRFRGPNGSGLSDATTIPAQFTASDFNWRTELKGSGHSSPVVWNDHIYLLIASADKEGERHLVCFSTETGKEIWRVEDPYEPHYTNKKLNSFASCTPVTAPEGVYFISSTGENLSIRALTHDGKDRWKQQLDSYTSDHGSASSPILVDGTLIVNTDSKEKRNNHIVGIDAGNGKILWSRERSDPASEKLPHKTVYSTPLVAMVGDQKTVAVVSTHHGWLGLNPRTGDVVWQHQESYPNRSVGSPVEKDGVLFATLGASGKGKLSDALRLKADGGVEVLYSLDKDDGLGYVPSPIFVDDLLYLWGDNGTLACRGALDGKEVYREKVGGRCFSSPIAINGRLFCGDSDGMMNVVQTGRTFKLLAQNDLGSDIVATPAVAGGRLIIRTKNHLISIGGKSQ